MERVTDRTARVIARVLAADTPFVLVTGRPPRWIPRVARAAGLSGYAVCANGASVYDIGADEVLSVHDIDPVQLQDVVRAVEAVLPEMRVAAERTIVGRDTDHPFAIEEGFHNPWGNPNGEGDRAKLVPDAFVTLAMEVTYSSNSGLIEISAAGVTKASGLAEVCELLDLAAGDVVAFGDMPNDEPMLRWVGHGVAMANAHPDLLAIADEVTAPNSEDGVAQVLERWF